MDESMIDHRSLGPNVQKSRRREHWHSIVEASLHHPLVAQASEQGHMLLKLRVYLAATPEQPSNAKLYTIKQGNGSLSGRSIRK